MRLYLVSLVLFSTSFVFSQKDKGNYNTLFLKEYKEDFYPFVFSNFKKHTIFLNNIGVPSSKLTFSPNSPLYTGLGFDYKWATFSYAWPVQKKTKRKGKNFNVFYGVSRRRYRISFMYQQYQGFFYDESNRLKKWFNHKRKFPFREDIKDYIIQGTFFYIFNHKKISYRSSFLYFEKQLKSAGSFTSGGNINVSGLSSDSSFIPKKLDSVFEKELNKQRVLDLNIGLKIGYIYNWVFHKNWHLAAHFSPVLYVNKDRFFEGGVAINQVYKLGKSIFFGSDLRLMLGYDNDLYYGGILYLNSNSQQDFSKSSFSTDYSMVEFYVGKRFKLNLRKSKSEREFK